MKPAFVIRNLFICFSFILMMGLVGCDRSLRAPAQEVASKVDDAQVILKAFRNRRSDIFVQSQGVVVVTLSDDLEGSRHQRFIVKLGHGQTLLISHNIDIAPRINDLKIGDRITFRGEYEWNAKGGLIHWTHHDPAGRRAGGWIEHQGKKYL